MKQRILLMLMALVTLCVYLRLSSSTLQNSNLAWIKPDSPASQNNLYFKSRQWLADARTLVAAVDYLYECRSGPSNSMDVAGLAQPAGVPRGNTTNDIGLERIQTDPDS